MSLTLTRLLSGRQERRRLVGRVDPSRLALTLGCQRSGTTLLHLALDAHPRVASLDEPDSYTFLRHGKSRHRPARHAARLNLKLPQMGYEPGGAQISALLSGGARGVYLYRDPRAVAASMSRLELKQQAGLWAERWPQVEVAALSRECGEEVPEDYERWSPWRRCLHHIRLKHWFYLAYLEGRVLPVCYERLVEDPEYWLRRIAGYLDIEFDGALLSHHARGTGIAVGGTRRDRPIDARSVRLWRKSLTAGQIREVEAACSEALSFWDAGYRASEAADQ